MSGLSPDDQEPYQLAGMAGLYALDALEGEDLVRFEALLATNAELRDEVAGFRATAARLSETSAASPPPDLRRRVLAEVATTRQDPPVVRLDDRRRTSARGRAALALVAAALVLLAGFGGYLLADRDEATPSQLAGVLARSDTQVLRLTSVNSERTGHVVISPDTGKVIIVSADLPPTAEGRAYEVWRLDAKGAHPAGMFKPDATGRTEAALQVGLDGATGFAITEEPEGGSAQPTTDVLMSATFQ